MSGVLSDFVILTLNILKIYHEFRLEDYIIIILSELIYDYMSSEAFFCLS